MEENIKVFKISTGEILIAKIEGIDDENKYSISIPVVVIPIPPEQSGAQNQVGFGKFMPFSDYSKEVVLNPIHIISESEPERDLLNAYKNWTTQFKAQQSGIVMPNAQQAQQILKDNNDKKDFSNLRT